MIEPMRLSFILFIAIHLAVATARAAAPSLNDLEKAEWRVRDVAAKSQWMAGDGAAAKLQLKLAPMQQRQAGQWNSSCEVIDTSGKDRAMTLALIVPMDASGATWWDDPQTS